MSCYNLSDAILEAGVSMKASNVDIEEGVALIEQLSLRGIKGSEAGTKLRNVLTKLSAAKVLPKEALDQLNAAGVDIELLADKSVSFTDKLKELNKISGNSAALVKTFGLENQDAASILIENANNIETLTKNVTGTNEAFEQAEKRTGTVGQEFTKLKNTFEALTIEFISGGGDFAETLKFIRENLEEIITVVGHLVRAFLVYKGVQMSINALWKAKDLTNYVKGLLTMNQATKTQTVMTKEATIAQANLNRTMNSNIIALVTIAVIELADALGFFESEADRVQARLDQIQYGTTVGSTVFDSLNNKQKEAHQERIKELEEKYNYDRRLAVGNKKELEKLDKDYQSTRLELLADYRDKQSLGVAKAKGDIEKEKESILTAQAEINALKLAAI